MSPFTDQDVQLDIFGFIGTTGSFERIGESPNWIERDNDGNATLHRTTTKRARCSRDIYCSAEADQHEPDCPVEQRLRDELGF